MSPVVVSISRLPPVTRVVAGVRPDDRGPPATVHSGPVELVVRRRPRSRCRPARSWNQSNAASTTGRVPVPDSETRPMRGLVMPAISLSVCGMFVHDSPSAEYDAVRRVPSLASRTYTVSGYAAPRLAVLESAHLVRHAVLLPDELEDRGRRPKRCRGPPGPSWRSCRRRRRGSDPPAGRRPVPSATPSSWPATPGRRAAGGPGSASGSRCPCRRCRCWCVGMCSLPSAHRQVLVLPDDRPPARSSAVPRKSSDLPGEDTWCSGCRP